MVYMRKIVYSCKLMLSGYLYGALLYGIGLLLLLANTKELGIGEAELHTLCSILLLGMAPFSILIFSNLFSEEMEERALGLIFTYRQKAVTLLIERVVVAALLTVLLYGLCLVTAHYRILKLNSTDVWEISKMILPANLYLASLALFFSLIGRNVLVGLGVGMGYFILEMMTMGQWTGPMFLFQSIWPKGVISLEEHSLYLLFASVVSMVFSILIFTYGKHRLAHNPS
ncbi:hypothetical protein KCTCHS21_45870 [Cohnella abietis]|uniref:Uncharacterized protein n=2 Tax=Cohnella abietis TaxID=2507935 RepID=A0A3T1DB28_9BACL|nr:hypothetical protein KCTCHS21_45870 [Cohnella abietis]